MKRTYDVGVGENAYQLMGEVNGEDFKLEDVKHKGVYITKVLKELSDVLEAPSHLILVSGDRLRFQEYQDGVWKNVPTYIHTEPSSVTTPWQFFSDFAKDVHESVEIQGGGGW